MLGHAWAQGVARREQLEAAAIGGTRLGKPALLQQGLA
jgi:hypothetical protein